MFHLSNMIAIPADYPPPEELPVEFYSYGACEIIDSESPGYVFLKLRYFVAECIDNGKYNAAPVNRDVSVSYTLQVMIVIQCFVDPHKLFMAREVRRPMTLRTLSVVVDTSRRLANATEKLRLARFSNC